MKTKSPAKKKAPAFNITLTIGDKTYKSEGASPVEALTKLPKPQKIMLKGVLKLSAGSYKHEILLTPPRIKRLFYNSAGVQEVIAKQLFAGAAR